MAHTEWLYCESFEEQDRVKKLYPELEIKSSPGMGPERAWRVSVEIPEDFFREFYKRLYSEALLGLSFTLAFLRSMPEDPRAAEMILMLDDIHDEVEYPDGH